MKKRILHVSCGGLGHGGVSTVIFSIVENLYDKFDFDCVVFESKGDREERFRKYGNIYRINCYSHGIKRLFEVLLRPFIMFRGIYKICKKNNYDIIHVHNNFEEGICLWAAKCAGVKIRISHAHNTASPKREFLLKKLREKFNLSLINKFATYKIGCSSAACEAFFKKKDYEVFFNAVDLSKFSYNRKTKKESNTFIHVGRYTYQKNQEFVVEVFSEIVKDMKDAKLKLVGFGPDENKLRKIVNDLNLQNYIEFVPGDKVDIAKEYDDSQYMIFPSRFEGFGIVLIEAQAKGIKCFVSKEAVQKEVDAGLLTFISLNESPRKWADIILDNINLKKEIDFSKVSNNLQKFSTQSISKQYESLYRGVCDERVQQ